jgi:cell division protein FtsN
MPRRGEAEYQFTTAHLIALAVCVLLTSSVVFLLGFYVGRESAALHTPIDERVARLPSPDERPAIKPAASTPARAPTPAAKPRAAEAPQERPPPPPDPAPPPPASGAVMPYTVQVVATRDRAEAEQIRAHLIKRSIGAYISEVEDGNGRWYRVRIGRYDDLAAARSMEARVRRDLGLAQAAIVPAATDSR